LADKHYRVLLAKPRGFCAGVERAIEIVERALQIYGPPVYVRHEIVHNKRVVDTLREKGAIFVEELDDCPDDRPVIFSFRISTSSITTGFPCMNVPSLKLNRKICLKSCIQKS